MIRVERFDKPPHFNEKVGGPGNDWLTANPNASPDKFPEHWRYVRKDLAAGFNYLCGYSAIFTRPGTVDHYVSKSSKNGRDFAYEWSNYRFASSLMNQRKGTWDRRILDPFEIGHGWFEILLPHLELIVVEEMVPRERLDDARFTLKTLGIADDEEILEMRQHYFEQFLTSASTLKGLEQDAPLIARAVKKRLEEINGATLDEARTWFEEFLAGIHTLATLRQRAPHLADEIDSLLARPDSRIRRRS